MMQDERAAGDQQPPAANDNGDADARVRIDAAVLTIARLIGRQMAREMFEQVIAANDNRPPGRYDE